MVAVKPEIVYPVFEVPHIHDGDTLWVRRRWHIGWLGMTTGGIEIIGQDDRAGVPVRLTDGVRGLDTPELKKEPIQAQDALADLQAIVGNWMGGSSVGLELVTWGGMSFDRILGDIRVPGSKVSLTSTMLARGWPAWKK